MGTKHAFPSTLWDVRLGSTFELDHETVATSPKPTFAAHRAMRAFGQERMPYQF